MKAKKIIIAGAGHGGLVCAGLLAEKGFDVTVYEKSTRAKMGYDWTDSVDLDCFREVGLPLPDESTYVENESMRFFNPRLSAPVFVPKSEKITVKLERKQIYDTLFTFCEERGVKFSFSTTITGPILDGMRVVGIKTTKKDIFGDLVVDACGLNSPLRKNLPVLMNIDREVGYCDSLYTWRGLFDFAEGVEVPEFSDEEKTSNHDNVFILNGSLGLGWVVTEKDEVDVLIGKIHPISDKEVTDDLAFIRKHWPHVGEKLLRGGTKNEIPLNFPLPVFVADGYVGVGDSAMMTNPINGSGITISICAGKMLASTILADVDGAFTKETLWKFNVDYITRFGADLSKTAQIKDALFALGESGVDFMFERGIITAAELSGAQSEGVNVKDMAMRVSKNLDGLPLMMKTAMSISKGGSIRDLYLKIPQKYDEGAVCQWAKDVKASIPGVER